MSAGLVKAISASSGIVNLLWNPLKDVYRNYKSYEENVRNVKESLEQLESHKKDTEAKCEQIKEEGVDVVADGAKDWLKKAERLIGKWKDFVRNLDSDPGNMYHRYKYSKIAQMRCDDIEKLMKVCPKNDDELHRPIDLDKAKKSIAKVMSDGQNDTRKYIMNQILDKLEDDDVPVVGLYGNALVGKTKMANDIMAHEWVKSRFEERVRAEVSETPNIKDIQSKIGEGIGCSGVNNYENERVRAFLLSLYMHYRKERKKLIILDDVTRKLDLKAVGISPSKDCKVLVISRERDVCEAMGATKDNSIEMKPLTLEEAQKLFWRRLLRDDQGRMEDQVNRGEYLLLAKKLLENYCRGLPFAVVALAKILQGQPLFHWQAFAKELRRKQHHDVFDSFWDRNLDHLKKNKDKLSFFLLTCLFREQSSIPIRDLTRLAMGLDLFQSVDNLAQAITLANTWVHDLISSSLIEPAADEDNNNSDNNNASEQFNVILPRLLRGPAFSLLQQEGQNYLVKCIPRWHTEEMCRNYTAMSLVPGCDTSRLSEFTWGKLQILILDHTEPNPLPNNIFENMEELKVLLLRGMELNLDLLLAGSTKQSFKNLRLLGLENCTLKGTIESTKNMEKLMFLSFCGSTMEELPAELIKRCGKLRLLDLSEAKIKKRISDGVVLGELSQLEGLYARNCFENTSECKALTSMFKQINMKQLTVLEITVKHPDQLPDLGSESAEKLKVFRICVGSESSDSGKSVAPELCRSLQFRSADVNSISDNHLLQELMQKSETLRVEDMEELRHIISEENFRFKFRNLQILEITNCSKMQDFSYTAFKAPNLNVLKVHSCTNLNVFFVKSASEEGKEDYIDEGFPQLKVMELHDLPNFQTMLSESNCTSTSSNDVQGKAFFQSSIKCGELEKLDLINVGQMVKLWDVKCKEQKYISGFKNLKTIVIKRCAELQGLASISIAKELKQLKELTIVDCPNMKSAITEEEEEEEEPQEQIFQALKTITLEKCPNLQVFITGNRKSKKLVLPSLVTVGIKECPNMQAFSSPPLTLSAPKLSGLKISQVAVAHIIDINSSFSDCFQSQNKPVENNHMPRAKCGFLSWIPMDCVGKPGPNSQGREEEEEES